MTNTVGSQWDAALESVERVALGNITAEDANLFDPRRSCAATVDELAGGLLDTLVRDARGAVPRDYFAMHLESLVDEIRCDRRAVMNSMPMCELRSGSSFGVQHCASRIIVGGYLESDGFVTSVNAKPYESTVCRHGVVAGPAWRRPDTPVWYLRYVLLGIGERVYMRAAELVPGARWKVGSLSPYSRKLRAKLHRAAPWQWEFKDCEVCRGVVDWRRASESDFPPH